MKPEQPIDITGSELGSDTVLRKFRSVLKIWTKQIHDLKALWEMEKTC